MAKPDTETTAHKFQAVPDTETKPGTEAKRICVIGAGPSGCAVLRAFKSAKEKGEKIGEVVCYEKQDQIGGLWNFSHHVGLDANQEACHNSMYRHLWSNGPKECLEFSDYGFEEHFGCAIPSFPPREVLLDYIQGRIHKSGIDAWVKCEHPVRECSFDSSTKKFTVRVHDLKKDTESEELFDSVLCCGGHFSTPNFPKFEGIENFTGQLLHAHDFRNAEHFTGKDILVIGTSYSAEDIASQCYKYNCKSVTCSWRTAPMAFNWPDNFKTVPLLTKIEGRKCTFKDGTTTEVDAIILCTGYQHRFPYMRPDLRLKTTNRLWIDDLHEGVVWPSNNNLFYIGMQDQWYTFNMFDAQAWYARDVILGRLKLPDRATMDKEWAEERKREEAIEATDEANIRYQAKYVKRLIALTDYPDFDIEGTVTAFMDWEHNKHENIMTFRDKSHKSVITGTVAPKHHTPWLTSFDDSVECYVDGNNPAKKSKTGDAAGGYAKA